MAARKSTQFFAVVCGALALLVIILLHAVYRVTADRPRLRTTAELVRTLELTDLCLFTEASYTRHLSLADLHTPFQDYPLASEHFPSGALVAPPPHLTGPHAPHD
jgi:hypothetical protein